MVGEDRRFSLQSVLNIVLLCIASGAASALFLMYLAEVSGYMNDWQHTAYPRAMVCSLLMGIGVYLLWRRSLAGGLLFLAAAAGVYYFMNVTPGENDRSFYDETIRLFDLIAAAGVAAIIIACVLEFKNLQLKPTLSLLPWSAQRRPDMVLMIYAGLSLLLLVMTTTGRDGAMYNLVDRPSHGQSIRAEDLLLALLVIANELMLIMLAFGERRVLYVLAALVVVDIVAGLIGGISSPLFFVLRAVALAILYWLISRDEGDIGKVESQVDW